MYLIIDMLLFLKLLSHPQILLKQVEGENKIKTVQRYTLKEFTLVSCLHSVDSALLGTITGKKSPNSNRAVELSCVLEAILKLWCVIFSH